MKDLKIKNFILASTILAVSAGVFLSAGISWAEHPATHVDTDSIQTKVVNTLETTYIELSWPQPATGTVNGYKIYRKTRNIGSVETVDDGLIADIPLAQLPFRDIDGADGRTVAPDNYYTYTIVPYNNYGEGRSTDTYKVLFYPLATLTRGFYVCIATFLPALWIKYS